MKSGTTLASDRPVSFLGPHFLGLWPWANCSTPRTAGFFNCKMGIIIVSTFWNIINNQMRNVCEGRHMRCG